MISVAMVGVVWYLVFVGVSGEYKVYSQHPTVSKCIEAIGVLDKKDPIIKHEKVVGVGCFAKNPKQEKVD